MRDEFDDIVAAFTDDGLRGVRAILKDLKAPKLSGMFLSFFYGGGSICNVTKEVWEAVCLLRHHFAVVKTFLCKLKDGTTGATR